MSIMNKKQNIHPDFQFFLDFKEASLIDLFTDLRAFLLDIYPGSNQLLYHTHALTTVFSLSEKLSDAYCMIPVYSNHLNLGFNKGSLIKDPKKLLTGTGKLIRHIPVKTPGDYRNAGVEALIKAAVEFAIKDKDRESKIVGTTISKIKR